MCTELLKSVRKVIAISAVRPLRLAYWYERSNSRPLYSIFGYCSSRSISSAVQRLRSQNMKQEGFALSMLLGSKVPGLDHLITCHLRKQSIYNFVALFRHYYGL